MLYTTNFLAAKLFSHMICDFELCVIQRELMVACGPWSIAPLKVDASTDLTRPDLE